jgi:hypothetical protein
MRAADLSWEAPPSPVKTSISSSAIIALQLRHKRYSVPPKESNTCFKFVRGCLPQSLHSPQFQSLTRFTLIYPSCSVFLFGNDRANRAIWDTLDSNNALLLGFLCDPMAKTLCVNGHKCRTFVYVSDKPYCTTER